MPPSTLEKSCKSEHRQQGEGEKEYWDQEVKKAEKDAGEPSLMKAIIKCYWKSYVVWGIFIFLEVKSFTYSTLLFRVFESVLRWTRQEGRESNGLRMKHV